MGLKDAAAKNFFGRTDVVASILDFVLYGGRPVVKTSQLREMCEGQYRIIQEGDGTFRTDNQFRDKLYEYCDGEATVAIGLEFQTRYDKYMVQRIMDYDSHRYRIMVRDGRILPIFNIVLFFDRRRRMLPCDLNQMLQETHRLAMVHFKDILKGAGGFFNYGYTGLNIYDIAEKLDMFPCEEMQDVLYLFKMENEGVAFMEAAMNGRLNGRLSRDAAIVCAVFLGLEIRIDDNEENCDMCKAVKDMKKKWQRESKALGIEEGRTLGIEEGRTLGIQEGIKIGEARGETRGEARGKTSAIKEIVIRLLRKSKSILEICDITGASRETVEDISLALQNES